MQKISLVKKVTAEKPPNEVRWSGGLNGAGSVGLVAPLRGLIFSLESV